MDVCLVAEVLAAQGDADPVDVRRAKAVGVLADPARAHELLSSGHDSPAHSSEVQVYVHVAEETLLTGHGVVRVEGVGPLAATMLTHLIGHRRVQLTPVVRPYQPTQPRHLPLAKPGRAGLPGHPERHQPAGFAV